MTLLTILAVEGGHGGDHGLYGFWLGVVVVISALVLFVGGPILLLSTNMGARKGIAVGGAGFFGLLMLLSSLWLTTSTPLNVPRGRLATWHVETKTEAAKLVDTNSLPANVRDIAEDGKEIPTDDPEFANVKASVDEALVIKTAEGGVEPDPEDNKYAEFQGTENFLITNLYEIGGSNPNPLKGQIRHTPLYAVAIYCPTEATEDAAAEPQCEEDQPAQAIVLLRDLGSLRFPPLMYFLVSGFGLAFFLLLLHWIEKDERRARSTENEPEPEPSDSESEKSEETVSA